MSRTWKKREGVKYQDGRLHSDVVHKCRCEHCTTRRNERKERIADQEMKRQLNDAVEIKEIEKMVKLKI